MSGARFAPATVDWQEHVWLFDDEIGLEFGRKHQVPIAFGLMREGGEDALTDAEIGRSHVGRFFGAGEA